MGRAVGRTGCVIVADGDEAIRRMVAAYFEASDVQVSCASNREELILYLRTMRPSLIVLNRKLGNWDGLDILRDLRSRSNVPVVIVAERGRDEVDGVVSLELGADDYIAKPFSARELLARTRAILRRQEAGRVQGSQEREQGGYHFGGWRLEQRTRTVIELDRSARIAAKRRVWPAARFPSGAPARPDARTSLTSDPTSSGYI